MYEPISNTTKKDFEEVQERIDAYQKELASRPRREVHGVEITKPNDKTRLFAICEVCEKDVKPPILKKRTGNSGVRYCDFCGAINSYG